MRRWLCLCSVVILLMGAVVPGRAEDAPGCDGLDAFRADLFPVGERWAEGLRDLGMDDDWSPVTMSSDDWLAYADLSLDINRALKAIDAPAWAQDWLDVRIDATALQEQIARAAAEHGVMIALGFAEDIESIERRDIETREAASAVCDDFAQFAYDWDALDGEVDGTPVAT